MSPRPTIKHRFCPVRFQTGRCYAVAGAHKVIVARRLMAAAVEDDPDLRFEFVSSPRLPTARDRVAIFVLPNEGANFSQWVGMHTVAAVIEARSPTDLLVTDGFSGEQTECILEAIPEKFTDAIADLIDPRGGPP